MTDSRMALLLNCWFHVLYTGTRHLDRVVLTEYTRHTPWLLALIKQRRIVHKDHIIVWYDTTSVGPTLSALPTGEETNSWRRLGQEGDT